jgi:hypothetical protein
MDMVQAPMDASNYDLITQTAANAKSAGLNGLPDDAVFPANADHPKIHLGWSNASDGPNSRVVKMGGTFNIKVPSDTYTQLQVYALSTEGKSTIQFTLNYADLSTDVQTIVFGDWYDDPAPAGQFFIVNGLNRIGGAPAQTVDFAADPAIAGVNLSPNPAKTLVSVDVNHLVSGGWFVFYGAAGW